jgi:galactokinase
MDKHDYEAVKSYFLDLVAENAVTINELLAKGHERFAGQFKEETGWYLYNVKLDLEARGILSRIYTDKKQRRMMISRSTTNDSGQNETEDTEMIEVNKQLKTKFLELFGKRPMVIHSPGRINLIGEHTDYNDGFVMPAAIEKGVQFAISNAGRETVIYSMKYKQYLSVNLNDIRPSATPWHNYLLGVIFRLQEKGYNLRNFSCAFDGDLPLGAGLSSSAAIECGFAFALNELFNLRINPMELIHIAQWAEHNFVGVRCGIMDQFASVMGRENHVITLDCRTLQHQYHPLNLGNYCILLCDTNVKHSLASSEYNTRRAECNEGTQIIRGRFPEVASLRDVTIDMIEACRNDMTQTVFNRCKYVVQENERVMKGSDDLQRGDMEAFGKKMFATHEGLQWLYEVSCPELDFLVDRAKTFHGIAGSRMMGGGFGGCTINLIESHLVGAFIEQTRTLYKKRFGIDLTYHVVKTGNGTSVIENP